MTALLKAADLTLEQFLTLLAALPQPAADTAARRIWLEAPDGWAFDWWSDPDGTLHWCGAGRAPLLEPATACLRRSLSGRLFAPDGELRWRTIPTPDQPSWRTAFLGNTDWVGATLDDHSSTLQSLTPQRGSVFLWGQQTAVTPGEWIELRIPHRFHYPIHANVRSVKVVVEQWLDDMGESHFVRLCDLEPA